MSNTDQNKVVSSLDKKLEKEAAVNKRVNEIYAKDPELHGKSRFQVRSQEIGLALLAVVIGSLGTIGIMLPNGLTFGGITGISRIIQKLTGMNYSLIYYVLALVVLIIVWIFLGFKEVRKIILMSLSYPTVQLILDMNHVVLIKSDDLFLVANAGVSGNEQFLKVKEREEELERRAQAGEDDDESEDGTDGKKERIKFYIKL